jgi:hypothetical protein
MILFGGLLWGVAVSAAGPVLEFAYPAGGAPGDEFEIEVGGSALSEATQAVVSGEGVTLAYLGPVKAVTLSKKGSPTVAVVPNRLRFKAVVNKDAVPGMRALRVSTAYRLSEPVGFEILSAMPEQSEAVTNRAELGVHDVAGLPVCLNGRVHGKSGDRYRFQAAKGMTVVALAEAATLPPGAFLPVLTFTGADGKPCEGVTVYDPTNAPVAVFEIPEDGAYALEVNAAAGEIGDACVYRVKLGGLPLITALSPATAQEGESLNVKLDGVNLPQKRVRLFTGGKNSALCLQAVTENAYALPSLRFDLAAEAAAPDFKVTLTPASLNIPADGSALVTLQVQRFNGFEGEVRARLDFPPLSIASEGGVIPPGQTTCQMTVSTDGVRFPRVVFGLSLVATAEINGQTVKRAVIPVRQIEGEAGRKEQAFHELAARANTSLSALRLHVAPKTPVAVPVKEPVRLTVLSSSLSTHLGGLYEPVVVYPPTGFTVQGVQRTNKQDRASVLLRADPEVLRAGASGQVILGCVHKEDKRRELMAVTQSVPFVVK